MREFNILTPGEKIKSIRTKFNIKQEELTGGDITRNLISIIENNKANLTESVAKILTYNINRICKERNMDFSVTEEYLMEDIPSQCKKICDEYIEFINNLKADELSIIQEKIDEIDLFTLKYNPRQNKAKLYLAIANKYIDTKQYNNAYNYYLRAYESTTLDMEITLDILLYLGGTAMLLSKYEEALEFYKTAEYMYSDIDNISKYLIYYNSALCCKKLNRYDSALELLNKLDEEMLQEILQESPYRYINTKEVKGNTLKELNHFNKALEVHESALKVAKNISLESELFVLSNIGEVYLAIKDTINLKEICKKMIDRLENNEEQFEKYGSQIYAFLGEALKEFKDYSLAKKYLFEVLNFYTKNESYLVHNDMICEIFTQLLEIYIDENDIDGVNSLRHEFFNLVSADMLSNYTTVMLRFIQYYTLRQESDEVNTILDFVTN